MSNVVSEGSETSTLWDVLVLGGGISGLTLGFRLKQKGYQVLIIEGSERPGGSISTQTRSGFCWEEGPNSFTPTPALLNLVADLNIADHLVWADARLPRYVYWDNQLLPVPMDPGSALTSPLLSLGGKLRALLGILGFVAPSFRSEETVAEFFERQLGQEVLQRLVIPFTSGVYAGNANQLSAKAAFARLVDLETQYGSLLAGVLQSPKEKPIPLSPRIQPPPRRGQLGNFREGMQVLPQALAHHLGSSLRLKCKAIGLTPTNTYPYQVEVKTSDGSETLLARSVVSTLPAYATAPLLHPLHPEVSEILTRIPYPTVAVVALGYPTSALPNPLRGFGHLLPRSTGFRTLGTIWSSALFSHRAPAGFHCLLNFIGGSTDPEYAQQRGLPVLQDLTPSQRAEIIHAELSQILLTHPVDPIVLGEKLWLQAIPQYELGHRERMLWIRHQLNESLPGIRLCSNYLDGVALGDCVKRAEKEALSLAEWLGDPSTRS
jgi:oxygen-dependent protoporphyrinogen oxidase